MWPVIKIYHRSTHHFPIESKKGTWSLLTACLPIYSVHNWLYHSEVYSAELFQDTAALQYYHHQSMESTLTKKQIDVILMRTIDSKRND